ncbi:SigE family RNA polymerase sigma factor [uncultured Cellulomonas sp.]|uniref:SigE family RNA polymerase sigma factor n=1 Tax=uncultured Cellulomonas sp. TaxID=189682 RepID=UPI0026177B64|nr:SigE family RNA polymerase sigma factor [uncultured Cellulomonas sp.]
MAHADEQFEEFVRLHGAALLRTAVLLTGNRDQGQDTLQDALELYLRRRPKGRVEFPAAYVRTAMVHLVQRRRLDRILVGGGQQHLDTEPARSADVDGIDLRQALLAALRTLPQKQRSAVVLRYWEGYSEAETAQMLRCSVGTVKSQASRGLSKLRETCAVDFPERSQGDTTPLILTSTGDLA